MTLKYRKILAALGIGLLSLLGYATAPRAQQNAVTAIDIALDPDATMMQLAKTDNARLLRAFPKGFALDATHLPHFTMLQQFVRTADLDKVYAAANKVLESEKTTDLEAEGGQILLHALVADRSCGHCRRADRGFAQAATKTHRRGCALHREIRDRSSVHVHRRRQ